MKKIYILWNSIINFKIKVLKLFLKNMGTNSIQKWQKSVGSITHQKWYKKYKIGIKTL